MTDSSTSEYSLWLAPDEETAAYRQLHTTITELADGQEDAPVFEPHITVVGRINGERESLRETMRTLASHRGPVEVAFESVRWSTTRHQCVFLLAEPTLELFELYEAARDALNASNDPYHPHLSLLYSDMGLQRRREITESIDSASLPSRITCRTLTLVETTGSEPEWETIASVSLSDQG